MRLLATIFLLLLAAFPARANDSFAEIALGGLVLKETDAISLDKEDLFISEEEVRVDYEFTNTTDKDVEALVAFPLPDQDYDEASQGGARDLRAEINFQTVFDGKPLDYEIVQQAFVKDKDVTARIAGHGLPLAQSGDGDTFSPLVKKLDEATRKALVDDGLLFEMKFDAGNGEETGYHALWSLRTTITRKLVFPAGRTVKVSHRYKPLVGGSVGGALNPESRTEDWSREHAARYCIEDSWFRSFDAQREKRKSGDNLSPYNEWWIGYVLKSGANWKGPIKDFRMVIDKGKPENLVSFCADGVKKIAPTQFEVRKTNFEPKDDVNILIVKWYAYEQ